MTKKPNRVFNGKSFPLFLKQIKLINDLFKTVSTGDNLLEGSDCLANFISALLRVHIGWVDLLPFIAEN